MYTVFRKADMCGWNAKRHQKTAAENAEPGKKKESRDIFVVVIERSDAENEEQEGERGSKRL